MFASDLDRTLIYSSKFLNTVKDKQKVCCVENDKGKEISYMHINAIKELEKIKKKGVFVPTTTRSISQFQRIGCFQDVDYAITSNGGTILYKGEILQEWETYINSVVARYKTDFDKIESFVNQQSTYIQKEITRVDSCYLYTKVKQESVAFLLDSLDKVINKQTWTYTLQGLKLYIMPKEISKENALKYLKNKLGEDILIVSGDGKLDKGMLFLADIALIPNNSEIQRYMNFEELRKYEIVPEGIDNVSVWLKKVLTLM